MNVHHITPPEPAAQPWYRQAFNDGYLDLYAHRDLAEAARAVEFLARALDLRPSHCLLDLCCGPGRHLIFLASKVGQAIGLDLSVPLLERAREHWRAAADLTRHAGGSPSNSPPPLIQADMRRIPLAEGSCDRVVNLFTSFGYFHDEVKNLAVLYEIARVLRPAAEGREAGLLALDHINREALLERFQPHSERALAGGKHVTEERRWDAASSRVAKEVTYHDPAGRIHRWRESVRIYRPEELKAMLSEAGLEPVAQYGDTDGRPWSPAAPRLILVARKKGAS